MSLASPLLGAGARRPLLPRGETARSSTSSWVSRPVLGLWVLVAIAWLGLAAMLLGQSSAQRPGGALWWCMAGMTSGSSSAGVAASVLRGLPMWASMSAAMMLPAAVPAGHRVALDSPQGPWRAVLVFAAIYLLAWLAFGVLALYLRALAAAGSGVALIAALGLAAAWQLTPYKRRALHACRRGAAPSPQMGESRHDVARFALRSSGSCIASCWAIMLAMAMIGSAQLIWAAGLTAAISAEKLMREPGQLVQCTSAVLAALAFDFTLAALV